MLEKYGLASAIVDAFDDDIAKTARGERENLREVVWKVMDGEDLDPGKLSPEEADYMKTAKVLLGQSLYSHSWLKL